MTGSIQRIAGTTKLPFSTAVRVGSMLYLSGQLGIDTATGRLVPGGIEAETDQALKNIEQVLLSLRSNKQHIIRCEVFLADFEEFASINRAYANFFDGDDLPARSAVAVSGMALDARVEIQAIACTPD
ncbi:MAG: RidA family protein [Pseudomonadales bacterium]|nr:RidA family protein [Pseudomonadales bacterium]